MNRCLLSALLLICLSAGTRPASAAVTANTTADGTVTFSYDRAAWATVAPSAAYTTISGAPTGTSGPTADATGQRWMYPDRFEGTSWVAASYPANYLTGVTQPLADTVFTLAVNTYGTNSFAANHKITGYNSTTNPYGYIGLGASFRVTSDFNEPGASVWWEHLALQKDSTDNIWKILATSGAGQGTIFELTNVTEETINGSLHLSGDYIFGNTDWYNFLQGNGDTDPNKILGHIELMPAGVPEPSRLLLAGLGAILLLLRRKRAA